MIYSDCNRATLLETASNPPSANSTTSAATAIVRPSSATGYAPGCVLPKIHSTSSLATAGRSGTSVKEPQRKLHSNMCECKCMTTTVPTHAPALPLRVDPATRATTKPAVRRAADMRINKTKTTVTELQKLRQDLEAQVCELSRRCESEHTEVQRLRVELRHERAARVCDAYRRFDRRGSRLALRRQTMRRLGA